MTSPRGRLTKALRKLVEERLRGCEKCSQADASQYLEDVLRPLRLRQNERMRLMRVLTCPYCESPLQDYYYDRVVSYEANEIRDVRRLARYKAKYESDFDTFHRFLLEHPTLGGCHPFGQRLAKAIQLARKSTLPPATWFHARERKDKCPFTATDLAPADPYLHIRHPGRFNCAGQLSYYMAQRRELAAIEVQGKREIHEPIWVSEIHVSCPIKVLDLKIGTLGQEQLLPLILTGLLHTGALTAYGDDASKPQYRVPQFLADLARQHKFDGIMYTRLRDGGPEGTNLVVFRPKRLDMQIEEPILYSWQEGLADTLADISFNFRPVRAPRTTRDGN